MLELSQPRIIDRDPYKVVGVFCSYEGEDEGPGWEGASAEFWRRKDEIKNRTDDMLLGFLYRPHKDHPEIADTIRSCFIGVEVTDFDHVPEGMAITQFSGGKYVIVESKSDNQDEAAEGVGQAIEQLEKWIPEQGYVEGNACFACSHEEAKRPPFIEYVYIKMDPP